jgi:hydroxymethylpyrimidine/phosphomethylpyrimidine kinase
LTGIELKDQEAAQAAAGRLLELGAQNVLIKLGERDDQSVHVLGAPEGTCQFLTPRLPADNTHGTGCILAAAIAAKLALGEKDIRQAVAFGIQRVLETISSNTRLGQGIHPAETRAMRPA